MFLKNLNFCKRNAAQTLKCSRNIQEFTPIPAALLYWLHFAESSWQFVHVAALLVASSSVISNE